MWILKGSHLSAKFVKMTLMSLFKLLATITSAKNVLFLISLKIKIVKSARNQRMVYLTTLKS